METINKHKILILSIATPLLVVGAILGTVWYLSFRVTRVDPNPVPLEARSITFYFSRDLDSNYPATKIFQDKDIPGSYSVGKNSITFTPKGQLSKGTYLFTFNDLRSQKGEVSTVKKKVTIKYVPYGELSSSEQKRQIGESDSNQGEYPITNGVVPYATAAWGIEYLLPEDSGSDKLTLTIKIFADQGTNEPLVDYQQRLEDIHTEVVAYIKDNNFDLKDYYVLYDNPYLATKYDQPAPDNL